MPKKCKNGNRPPRRFPRAYVSWAVQDKEAGYGRNEDCDRKQANVGRPVDHRCVRGTGVLFEGVWLEDRGQSGSAVRRLRDGGGRWQEGRRNWPQDVTGRADRVVGLYRY